MKNDGSPLKCFICGYILPGAGGRASSEPPRARRSTQAVAEPFAAIGDRMLALILDRVVILAILLVPAASFAAHGTSIAGRSAVPVRTAIVAAVILTVSILAYHIVLESIFGATLGKGLLGLQVRTSSDDGRWRATTIRNALRLVDGQLFYSIAFLVAVFSPRRQRLGDHLAGTTVVEQRVAWGARLALIFIWVVLVSASIWLASWLCPSCFPDPRHLPF